MNLWGLRKKQKEKLSKLESMCVSFPVNLILPQQGFPLQVSSPKT